ncbi:MAG: archaetidylserine decarboxylase, partial [Terriglobales bacterium]
MKERCSRLAGRLARSPASRWLIPWYARHYGVAMEEAQVPERGFASLQQFFSRELRPGLRPIASGRGVLASPCDGSVGACGTVAEGLLLQAKGRRYRLAALLAGEAAASGFEGGLYCTIYLSPRDYHRVHAPVAGAVRQARYIPGAFSPVHPRAVASIAGLFAANQRLVTWLETSAGMLAVVMVGACLVGAIRVAYDPGWNAGPSPHAAARRRYDP